MHLNDLPPELLHLILVQTAALYDGEFYYYAYLVDITLVCRAWRCIILANPNLWTLIAGAQSNLTKLTMNFTEILRTTRTYILLASGSYTISRPPSRNRLLLLQQLQSPNFWNEILNHQQRWADVSVTVSFLFMPFASFVQAPCPVLRRLSLTFNTGAFPRPGGESLSLRLSPNPRQISKTWYWLPLRSRTGTRSNSANCSNWRSVVFVEIRSHRSKTSSR